ncbi:uncharacterized protein PHACADRAFT_194873 [Phanerochaete carnosa HHB-10118-sp]|uniref:Integrase catalytic domain-containing protein n=1 Tax=Phanerochaete carnosa (strain HHB-10118-sp) TaxID=650164 RepID=K5WE61_PHACS|nr:uncharacterized protein PHACADRAFT_194873 [Phanerochaete carnosa HHB-10118-sp]EKM57314.1 hypothetical protein PHACADRAFT_194873 [Phanerochaete carnosa HHB-10118-sp]
MSADSERTTAIYGGGGHHIEPLRGPENFVPWTVRMEDILDDMDYWPIVKGELKKPENDKEDKWTKKDHKTLTQIHLCVSEAMIPYIMSTKTSKDAWDMLQAMFKVSGPIAAVLIRWKLFRYMMEEGSNVEEQICTLRGYQEQLVALDSAVSDKDFAFVLLTALPDSWDPFVSALDTSDLEMNKLIGRILAEDNRRKARATTETTLFAKKGKEMKKGKFRKGVTCYNCNKEGHLASECRGLKKNAGSSKPSKVHHTLDHNTDDSYEFNIFDKQTFFLFTSYHETPDGKISGAGSCRALRRETVSVIFKVDGRNISVTLQDAIHAPDLPSNLISMGRLTKAGFTFGGLGDNFFIKKGDRTIGRGRKFNNLYQLDVTPAVSTAYIAKTGHIWYKWHCILGHLNKAQLRDLKKHSVGMNVNESSDFDFACEPCIQAKQARRPFPKESETQYKDVGELTVFDTWGPARTESIHCNRYYVSFTDAKSRDSTIGFMRSRDAALDHFKKYKACVEKQTRKKLKAVRCDNAKEFVDGKFKAYLDEQGIILEMTAPYSPAQNGIAEHLNRTLVEYARAMLIAKNLPKFLWEDAVAYACFLKNQSPTRALGGKTPYEAFWGKVPNISDLHEFGSDVWVLRLETQQNKLEAKSEKFLFTGFSNGSRAY